MRNPPRSGQAAAVAGRTSRPAATTTMAMPAGSSQGADDEGGFDAFEEDALEGDEPGGPVGVSRGWQGGAVEFLLGLEVLGQRRRARPPSGQAQRGFAQPLQAEE